MGLGSTVCVLGNRNANFVLAFNRKSHGINDFAARGFRQEVLRTHAVFNAVGFTPLADDFCIRVIHDNPGQVFCLHREQFVSCNFWLQLVNFAL